jgi:hypothetical protein
MKDLSIFKQNVAAPLSPSIQQNISFQKEAIIVCLEGNQCCNKKSKSKIKSQKPVFKDVRDMLTKKGSLLRRINTWEI